MKNGKIMKNSISGLTLVCGAVGQATRSSQKRLEVEDRGGNGGFAEFPNSPGCSITTGLQLPTIHQRCVSNCNMFDPKIHKQRLDVCI